MQVDRRSVAGVRMAIALPYGTVGIWEALRFLLQYRISVDSNR